MTQPDFESAHRYAFERLKQELSPNLFYHDLRHTFEDVLPAVTRFATMANISPEDTLLVRTAAVFHDTGFLVQSNGHEAISVQIANAILPKFGYTNEQIKHIDAIIMATQLPQSPQDFLGQIICDADLDVLGRDDFFPVNLNLKKELETMGNTTINLLDWYKGQRHFLQTHTYFTDVAKELRNERKATNIEGLSQRIAELE
ncbi:MAG TPA: HD domain-containing protein [Anaerolineae bacterium]|nr:HD domain-containing protein [Anaerolineae bacterium]